MNMLGTRLFGVLLFGFMLGMSEPTDRHADDKAIKVPEGGLRTTTVDDVRPNLDVKHENWSYRFILDGGLQLYIDLRRADLGTFKGKVLGADLSLVGFKGKDYAVSREYPPENLTFDEINQRLSVHPKIWFEGRLPATHKIHYATRKRGVSYYVDLTFFDIVPGCAWGDGLFHFGDDEVMGMTLPIPKARVRGTVAVNGDTLNVTGTGYMDHVFQSDRLSHLIDAGFRVISHDRGWEVGLFLQPTDRYDGSVVGYGAFDMGSGRALYRPTDMTIAEMGEVGGEDVPARIVLVDAEGRQRVLERDTNLQKLSMLREVGGIKKFIARKIAGGDVIMFRGVGTIDHTRPMVYDFFVID